MKLRTLLRLTLMALAVTSCKKEDDDPATSTTTYADLKSFHQQHDVPSQHFTVNAATGGSFTATGGTVITVPPNAFQNALGTITSGTIEIEVREVYSTLDMLLTDLPTVTENGILKSGGEVFIKALVDGEVVEIADSAFVEIAMPVADSVDFNMEPFVWLPDTVLGPPQQPQQVFAWSPWPSGATVTANASNYIFTLYQFSSPVSSGTWCNSDNPWFFNGPEASLDVLTTYDPDTLYTEVFMVFPESNSVVHVYKNYPSDIFKYLYAPVGKESIVVGLMTLNGKLHSSFTTVTIGNNTSVTLDFEETTFEKFKEDYEALM